MIWTKDQQRVIDHKKGDLLVAAAAGSGKTAVLVEHVISRIMDEEDPLSLEQMVIMTFTDAAAQEMRERIKLAIDQQLALNPDNSGLIREAGNIQNANISTIDSFCKKFITENYAAIDLDPGFRMGDSGELKLLKSDIIAELLEEYYARGNSDFLYFVDTFATGKGDSGIEDIILRLHDFAEAHPWPMEYLDSCMSDEGDDRWKDYYLSQLKGRLADDVDAMEYALSLCSEPGGPDVYIDELTYEINAIEHAYEASDLESVMIAVNNIKFERLKPSKSELKDAIKNIRDSVKDDISDIKSDLIIPDKETEAAMQAGISSNVHVLVELTRDFIDRFQEEKTRRHVLDFGDLEHKALEILYTTDDKGLRHYSSIADDYAHQYREILVDEYQDSNYVQEELIRALSAARFGRPDVFQVGDVKQSIYSFRQARPDLFLAKYNDTDYPTIVLSQNFRSRNEVISAANNVFKRIMRAPVGGIDYTDKAALHYGFPGAEYSHYMTKQYETELLVMQTDEKLADENVSEDVHNKDAAEAHMIAQRIDKLHNEQNIPYRDIVILTRSPGSWADTIVDVLNEVGIPAYCTSNEGYFNAVEVETVLSMLNVIDNPEQDIPLAAIMHSAIYDFSDEDMAEIVASRGTLRPIYTDETDALQHETDIVQPASDASQQGEITAPQGLDDAQEDDALVSQSSATEKEHSAFTNPKSFLRLPEVVLTEEEQWERDAEIYGIYKIYDESVVSSHEPLRDDLAKKLLSFYKDIERYRQMSHYLSIHELLYRIYDETGYYNYASAMPAGNRRKANLDALIDMALAFERTSYKGLFDYIRYIEKLKKYDNDQGESSVYSDQDDLVRIMSIHKSKGLQFPVVFLSGLGRKFNKQDLAAKILVDSRYGIGCNYVDLDKKVKVPSLKRLAIRDKLETEQLGEELRVLYVGMTRAVDKLILTGTVANITKLLDKYRDVESELSSTAIKKASNYLEWIIMAEGAARLEDKVSRGEYDPISLKTFVLSDIDTFRWQKQNGLSIEEQALIQQLRQFDVSSLNYIELENNLSFKYPHLEATSLYPKHSVSEIKETEIERFEADRQAKGQEHWHVTPDNSDTEVRYNVSDGTTPKDRVDDTHKKYTEKAGADVGNAYHHAFEKYDYTDAPDNFMVQLRDKLPAGEYELIKESRFKTFLDTELAQRFRKAQVDNELFREQHFMIQLPHNELFGGDVTEDVLLQGIIDAFFIEDDEIVLVDYKTDHVKDADTLIGRYKTQLELYADALTAITGKRVKERLIYSVILGRTIAV